MADRARSAAERALALDPQIAVGYAAPGNYHRLVTVNNARAARSGHRTKGLALVPNDVELLRFLGLSEQALGRWEEAVEHLRRARTSGSPVLATVADALGFALLWLRRYEAGWRPSDAAWRFSRPLLNMVEISSWAMIPLWPAVTWPARGVGPGRRAR